MSDDFYQRQQELMAEVVAESDVVITTAAVPGKQSPMLISKEAVEGMAPGSVIVDLAAERGGNCELSQPDQRVDHQGVAIFGPTNLPSEAPTHASQMFSRNVTTLLLHVVEDGKWKLDLEDSIVKDTLAAHDGIVRNERLRGILELPSLAPPEAESDEANADSNESNEKNHPELRAEIGETVMRFARAVLTPAKQRTRQLAGVALLIACALAPCNLSPRTAYALDQPSDAKPEADLSDPTSADPTSADPARSAPANPEPSKAGMDRTATLIASLTVFVLAVFVGFEIITKVPPTLHTPLMSGSNAVSGITLVGALLVTGGAALASSRFWGFLAVTLAAVNVVGGFLVTHRMLSMFNKPRK